MLGEGSVYFYESDKDDDVVDDEAELNIVKPLEPVERTRGKCLSRMLIAEHPTLLETFNHNDRIDNPVHTRKRSTL